MRPGAADDITPVRSHCASPKPIRYDVDTWLIMRDDPVIPKAVIERRRDRNAQDVFFVLAWDLAPTKRVLMGSKPSLPQADDMVLCDVLNTGMDGPPNDPRNTRTALPRPV